MIPQMPRREDVSAAIPEGFVELPHDAQLDPLPNGFQDVPANARLDPLPANGGAAREVGPEMQGGFADQLPPQAASHMSPEDEAAYRQLAASGSADAIQRFLQQRGFASDPAALARFIQNRDKANAMGGRVNYDPVYQLPKLQSTGTGDALARGVIDTLLLGTAPKIGAAIAGAESALQGNGFTDAYNRMLDNNNAVVGADEQQHPWMRVAGQLLGGLAIPSTLEGVGLKAGTEVLRAGGTMADARAAAQIAVRNRMALEGAAIGGAHGVGSADNIPDALTGGLVEGALGGVTGGLLGQGGRAARAEERIASATDDAKEIGQAALRQGIDPMPADVGGPLVRGATAFAAKTPFGSGPVINAAENVARQAQVARDRVAASVGQALDPEGAGQAALAGAQKYIADSRDRVSNIYRAAEGAAGDTKVAPTKALQALDANIAELADTPGEVPGLQTLQGLRDALSKGDISVGGLRRMRTALRDQFMRDGLTGSDIERRTGQVLDAAREDITTGLNDAGKGNAASLFTQADAAHAARLGTVNNVLQHFIGSDPKNPKSGEEIMRLLNSDLRSNNARAVKFFRALPENEQKTVAASIIGGLGRPAAGNQNAAGDAFSLPTFLTNWTNKNFGETAKRAFFGDESRAALNDLAKVAEGAKAAQKYANTSNTGGVLEFGRIFTALTALPTLGGSIAGQYALGRLLASPRFARWLARAPKTSLSPVAYADRLTRIARAEPAIANEVLQLQQRLVDHFGNAPVRAAASPNEVLQTQGNAGNQQPQDERQQP